MNDDIRKNLDQHMTDISSEQLDWSVMGPKIQKRLAEEDRKKRRFLIWWIFIGVLMLIILLGFLISTSNQALNPSQPNHVISDVPNNIHQQQISTPVLNATVEEISTEDSITGANTPLAERAATTKYNQVVAGQFKKSNMDQVRNSSDQIRTFSIDPTPDSQSTSVPLVSKQEPSEDIVVRPFLSIDRINVIDPLLEIQSWSGLALHLHVSTDITDTLSTTWSYRLMANFGVNQSNFEDNFYHTQAALGLHTQFTYEHRIADHFFGGIGVQYDQVRFVTKFESTKPLTIYQPNTIRTVYRYDGEDQYYDYTDSIPAIRSRAFSQYNTISSYSIPVYAGWTQTWNQLSLDAIIGLRYVLSQRTTGVLSNAGFDLSALPEKVYDYAMIPQVSVRMGYQVSDHIGIHSGLSLERSNLLGSNETLRSSSAFVYRATAGLSYYW